MTFDQILEGETKKEDTAWSTVGAAQKRSIEELLNNLECGDGRIGEGGGWMTNRSRLV